MIIKMKNGTHIHMLNLKFFLHFFGDQTTNETTWNPRKYWFPFIIQKKWRFSLSHLCFSLFEWDTLVVYIRYTWKSTNSFFFHRCDIKKEFSSFVICLSLSHLMSLIEHILFYFSSFSFWQWKKRPFKGTWKTSTAESQSLYFEVRSMMLCWVCKLCGRMELSFTRSKLSLCNDSNKM